MKNFFLHHRLILVIATLGVLTLFGLLGGRFLGSVFDQADPLAQIISVETELLKEWQRSNGLESKFPIEMQPNPTQLNLT